MASLHRDPKGRSPYFYAAFGLPNGKRAFRSTKQTNHKQALRVALEWEKAAELAGRGELPEAASRRVLDLIRESVDDTPLEKPQTAAARTAPSSCKSCPGRNRAPVPKGV